MDNEDRDLLHKLTKKLDKTIDDYLHKHGIDRAFFRFDIDCHLLYGDFSLKETLQLLHEGVGEFAGCAFCGKPTLFNHKELNMCAKCYADQKDKTHDSHV